MPQCWRGKKQISSKCFQTLWIHVTPVSFILKLRKTFFLGNYAQRVIIWKLKCDYAGNLLNNEDNANVQQIIRDTILSSVFESTVPHAFFGVELGE